MYHGYFDHVTMKKFVFNFPPPSVAPHFEAFAHEAFGAPSTYSETPTQEAEEFICPVNGCRKPAFRFVPYTANGPELLCLKCDRSFKYIHDKVHEYVIFDDGNVPAKYCPFDACGAKHPAPKAAFDHDVFRLVSAGPCANCNTSWGRSQWLNSPKKKPWVSTMTPTPSAPPLSATSSVELTFVKPAIYDPLVPTSPEQHALMSATTIQQAILRTLISIDTMLKRQEGVLQTVVGQRLERIEDCMGSQFDTFCDKLDEIASHALDLKDAVDNAVYTGTECDGNYVGSIKVYDMNA